MSGRDSWIAVILAAIATIPLLYFLYDLSKKYPSHDINGYSELILGKYAGKLVTLVLALFFIIITTALIRDFSDLVNLYILSRTPLPVIVGITVSVVSYAVKQRIENIGRMAFFLLAPALLLFFTGLSSSFQELDFSFYKPVLQYGFGRVALGTITQLSYFGLVFVAGMLLHITLKNDFKKDLVFPFTGAVIFTLLVTAMLFINFQETKVENFVFKLFMLFRQTHLIRLNNLDALFLFLWTFTFLTGSAVFHYVAVVSIAKLVETKSYQAYVLPVGVIIASLAVLMFENRAEFIYFAKDLFPYLSILITFGVPLLLYVFSLFKKPEKT